MLYFYVVLGTIRPLKAAFCLRIIWVRKPLSTIGQPIPGFLRVRSADAAFKDGKSS